MAKIKLELAYDGTDFHGFARQRGLRTVQGTIEETLRRVIGQSVEVFGSGRTDAGVHARHQVVHWEQSYGPPPERYTHVLNRVLPVDIVALRASAAEPGFHARFSAVRKTYRYTLQRAPQEDVFTRRYAWHQPELLDVEKFRAAAAELVGTHDFTSFCAASTPVEDKTRTVFDIHVVERGTYCDLYCTGSGFLQYMVRIITGTLVDIGQGRLTTPIQEVLQGKDRRLAGRTASPHGLVLWNVDYGESGT